MLLITEIGKRSLSHCPNLLKTTLKNSRVCLESQPNEGVERMEENRFVKYNPGIFGITIAVIEG